MTSLMSFGNSNVTSTTFTAVSTFPLLVKVVQQLKPCHALAELLVDRLSVGTPQLLSVGTVNHAQCLQEFQDACVSLC